MAEVRITVLDQLDQIEDLVLEGSRIPFSGGRLVNEQEAIELVDALREALPSQLAQAEELLLQRESFIDKARQQADEILAQARREREQLISSATIRQEAEKQATELREQARQQCEQILLQGRQQTALAEQEHQSRMAQMEQQFALRRQQLEQESQTRRQQLEQEATERNRQLVEQHERGRHQAMQELETIRLEGCAFTGTARPKRNACTRTPCNSVSRPSSNVMPWWHAAVRNLPACRRGQTATPNRC